MSEYKEEKSVRDLIGSSLQKNNLAMGAALILVASISTLDLVLPPLGVPSALLLIWLISWLLRSSWSDLGVRRPRSWGKTITIGISVGIITQLFALFVLIPLLQKTNIEPLDYSRFKTLNGNFGMFLMYLTISWTTAGFGEELIFRGFLMGHFARLFGGKKAGWWLSLVVVSVIFALVHAYQGPMGMILIMFPAILFGIMYIMSGFNLWYTIIAHGTADTFVFLMFFTGFAEILL